MEKYYESSNQSPYILKLDSVLGACAICFEHSNNLKNIENYYLFNNSAENYKEMLLSSFNIQLYNPSSRNNDVEICEGCICRLRIAYSFRKLVEAAGVIIHQKVSLQKSNRKSINRKSSSNKFYSRTKEKSSSSILADLQAKELSINMSKMAEGDIFEIKLEEPSDGETSPYTLEENIPLKHIKLLNDNEKSNFEFEHREDISNTINLEEFGGDDFELTQESSDDGESSTNSLQMKAATGYVQELQRCRKRSIYTIPPLDNTSTTCPICNKSFELFKLLSKHYENHFPQHLCHLCGMSYVRFGSYYGHMQTHHQTRWPCKLCSKTFMTPNAVSAHIRMHHNKVKPMGCYLCDERFSNVVSKRKHMAMKHGVQCKMHPCTDCEKTFYSASTLAMHVKNVHMRVRNYLCHICDKGFFAKQYLRHHMVKHTNEKKFNCDICGKRFPRLKSLTEHLKIHANIKKHVCDVCQKAFVQKCSLKSHMKTHVKNCN